MRVGQVIWRRYVGTFAVPGTQWTFSPLYNPLEKSVKPRVADQADDGINIHVQQIMKCKSFREVRKAAEGSLSSRLDSVLVWSTLANRAIETHENADLFDAVSLLRCFGVMYMCDKGLLNSLADVFTKHASSLTSAHITLILTTYEHFEVRPRLLYVQLFHSLLRLSDSLLNYQLADVFTTLAKVRLANPQVIDRLSTCCIQQIEHLRPHHISSIYASMVALDQSTPLPALENRFHIELESSTIQELLHLFSEVASLEIRWTPFDSLLHDEFIRRLKGFKTAEDVDQFADPFEALTFVQTHGMLSQEFLEVIALWASKAVYRPPTRSQKRPLAHQLVLLYDLMRECGLEDNKYLTKAIHKFVSTKGGLDRRRDFVVKPLQYQPGRQYIKTDDPLAGTFDDAYSSRDLRLTDSQDPPEDETTCAAAPELRAPAKKRTPAFSKRVSYKLFPKPVLKRNQAKPGHHVID